MNVDSRPTVVVWKNKWLPSSETFIRDQIHNLREWRALRIGFTNLKDGLPLPAHYAPYSNRRSAQTVRLLAGTRPFRTGYRELVRANDGLLLHAHFGSGGVNALPVARDTNIPLVTTFHGTDASTYGSRSRLLNQRYLRQLGTLFKEGDLLIAVSRYVADRLLAAGAPQDRIRVHYTGTNVAIPPADRLERTGVLFAGRLVAKKGVPDLLQAMARLPPSLRDTRLTIVGDGYQRPDLETLAGELRVNARFTGWMGAKELDREFRAHSVFCAPSHRTHTEDAEGFGMVYVEAALREMPIVAYATGGTQEAVENGYNGILVRERSVEELSGALAQALDPITGNALGTAGRRRAIKMFDIRTQTAELERTYEGLVAR